jgi:hypothetical protein
MLLSVNKFLRDFSQKNTKAAEKNVRPVSA